MIEIEMTAALTPEVTAILARHGCQVLETRLLFPEGTQRKQVFPRTYDERHLLTLPDGYVCMVQYLRLSGQCILFYTPEPEQA
ncbi:MAG: hypothetical protein H0U76_13035 [Ktedonobacteraceae bacterium]|nr:hypothetical protein [Ktedonobacteraceae bacterium]